MSFFFKQKKTVPFAPGQQPAVRRSICTGEMTVGYIDSATGKFHEIQLVPDRQALEDYFRGRGVEMRDVKEIY